MKIERKDYVPMSRFGEIAEGDVFIDAEGDVCMKIETIQVSNGYPCYNTIVLDNGEITFLESSEHITLPRFAKLVIE